jgi:hypothetical protein
VFEIALKVLKLWPQNNLLLLLASHEEVLYPLLSEVLFADTPHVQLLHAAMQYINTVLSCKILITRDSRRQAEVRLREEKTSYEKMWKMVTTTDLKVRPCALRWSDCRSSNDLVSFTSSCSTSSG